MLGMPLWTIEEDLSRPARLYYFDCLNCRKVFKAEKEESEDGCPTCGSVRVKRGDVAPVRGRPRTK